MHLRIFLSSFLSLLTCSPRGQIKAARGHQLATETTLVPVRFCANTHRAILIAHPDHLERTYIKRSPLVPKLSKYASNPTSYLVPHHI